MILFCCYQIASAMLDSMQAARMLTISEGPPSYRATQEPLDPARVAAVLNRRGQSSWGWLAALGVLALSPFCRVRSGSINKTNQAEQASDGDA